MLVIDRAYAVRVRGRRSLPEIPLFGHEGLKTDLGGLPSIPPAWWVTAYARSYVATIVDGRGERLAGLEPLDRLGAKLAQVLAAVGHSKNPFGQPGLGPGLILRDRLP